jgi:hypothetical protein
MGLSDGIFPRAIRAADEEQDHQQQGGSDQRGPESAEEGECAGHTGRSSAFAFATCRSLSAIAPAVVATSEAIPAG